MSRTTTAIPPSTGRDRQPLRRPAVAGAFYPAGPDQLARMTRQLFEAAERLPADGSASLAPSAGILVPHAGLVYSGVVAAAGWSRLSGPRTPRVTGGRRPTVVILGTNHGAAWLDGVAVWETGGWRTPLGDLDVDDELAAAVVDLGWPFAVDREAHEGEHSIEVQLPLLLSASPGARIVPLSVSAGVGRSAIAAGERLGRLLAARLEGGAQVSLAISSDMAHYPAARACAEVTRDLLPPILAVDPGGLAARESAVSAAGVAGLVCGMCGIQPAVLGLAALRALGAVTATPLAAATSADAGGPDDRTVGYLSVAFDLPRERASAA